MKNQENDTFSLAHTTWKCQYHIVFTPKYHRKVIYGALRAEIGKILRELCRRKDVEIIEAHAMPDHIHILVSIPPNERVSSFMGYLKGKSTMIIFERYGSPEIQIREQTLLESWLLCEHDRRQQASRAKIHTKPRDRRYDNRSDQHGGVLRSVQTMAGKQQEKI